MTCNIWNAVSKCYPVFLSCHVIRLYSDIISRDTSRDMFNDLI